jgi:beta-propeller uncharacterized protein DUF5122
MSRPGVEAPKAGRSARVGGAILIEVRTKLATGSLIGLTILLAGCSAPQSSVSSTAGLRLLPAQVRLSATLADQSCNRGHGVILPVNVSKSTLQSTLLRALSLPDGDVLVGTDSDQPPPSGQVARLVIRALTAKCTLDARFGIHGVDVVALPATTDHGYSTVNGWAPDGNGVVLAGSTATNGYVMELAANGSVDARFGTHGAVTLITPHPSSYGSNMDNVAVAPSGQIIVGADDGNAHYLMATYVARLDPSGALDRSFGSGGWSQTLATGALMQQVAVQSDGSVLAVVTGIDTGGGTADVYELDVHGSVVSSFTSDLGRAFSEINVEGTFQTLSQVGYFDDGMVPLSGGSFELVGTGALNAAGADPMYMMALRLTSGGNLDPSYGNAGLMSRREVDGGTVAALLMPDGDTVFVDEPWITPRRPIYGSNGTLRLTFLTPTGSLDESKPGHGVAIVLEPDLLAGTISAYATGDSAAAATGDDILVVVATTVGIDVLGLRG